MSLSLSESGCWCCGGGGGGDGDGGGGEGEDGVCNCGEGADLSSEALFLVITVLSVCVQVVFTLGIGCTPSGSLPYLQRRCPLRKYMMGWHMLGVATWFLLLMLRMDVLMRVIASSRTDCIWSYFVKWFRCDVRWRDNLCLCQVLMLIGHIVEKMGMAFAFFMDFSAALMILRTCVWMFFAVLLMMTSS